tara:strand:+ start:832 stop:2184 length:1353 start_codon:yes stop_codon:yes gene_type:complete
MANQYINPGVIDPTNPEAVQIMRRQKMAEQLMAQGQEPLNGQMISGHYVAPSWTQQLAKGLNTYMGAKGMKEASEEQKALAEKLHAQNQDEIGKFTGMLQGTPAANLPGRTTALDLNADPNAPQGQSGPVQPGQAPNLSGAMQYAAQSQNPQLQQFGLQGSMAQAQAQMQQQQAEQARAKAAAMWQASGGDPQKALAMGMPADMVKQFAEAKNLGKEKGVVINGQLVDPTTGVAIGSAVAPQANPASDLLVKDPVTGKLVPNTPLIQAKAQISAAGASKNSVSVNTGQKGFDNTLKLRGDFRSEPIYKAHQEMQSAYSQIGAGLKQGTPVGDLASATKIMKLLDPGSVVRESELGMAMAASGLGDRLQNYAQNVISGNKLTPQQRKDFQALADQLYSESVTQYNAKRGEYSQIADRNELNTLDVVGTESKLPAPSKAATANRPPLSSFGK